VVNNNNTISEAAAAAAAATTTITTINGSNTSCHTFLLLPKFSHRPTLSVIASKPVKHTSCHTKSSASDHGQWATAAIRHHNAIKCSKASVCQLGAVDTGRRAAMMLAGYRTQYVPAFQLGWINAVFRKEPVG
jgi:hypothetical protein